MLNTNFPIGTRLGGSSGSLRSREINQSELGIGFTQTHYAFSGNSKNGSERAENQHGGVLTYASLASKNVPDKGGTVQTSSRAIAA